MDRWFAGVDYLDIADYVVGKKDQKVSQKVKKERLSNMRN